MGEQASRSALQLCSIAADPQNCYPDRAQRRGISPLQLTIEPQKNLLGFSQCLFIQRIKHLRLIGHNRHQDTHLRVINIVTLLLFKAL